MRLGSFGLYSSGVLARSGGLMESNPRARANTFACEHHAARKLTSSDLSLRQDCSTLAASSERQAAYGHSASGTPYRNPGAAATYSRSTPSMFPLTIWATFGIIEHMFYMRRPASLATTLTSCSSSTSPLASGDAPVCCAAAHERALLHLSVELGGYAAAIESSDSADDTRSRCFCETNPFLGQNPWA